MGEPGRTYLPATGNHWALPLYDPLVKLLGADRARAVLLEQAVLRPGHRVLDIGCGTGTLAVSIKRQHPNVDVVGLDPDPTALALDFATPDPKSAGRLSRWLHSGHRLKDNSDEQIVSLLRRAGLSDAKRVAGHALFIGHIAYYQGSVPT